MGPTKARWDAECPGCGERIGWGGDVADGPACPKCGYRLVPAELASDLAEIEHVRRAIAAIREARINKDRVAMERALAMAAAPVNEPGAAMEASR